MDCKAEEGYKCFQYMCFPWNRFHHLCADADAHLLADVGDFEDKEWYGKTLKTLLIWSFKMTMRIKDEERKCFIFSPDLRKIGYSEENVRINRGSIYRLRKIE